MEDPKKQSDESLNFEDINLDLDAGEERLAANKHSNQSAADELGKFETSTEDVELADATSNLTKTESYVDTPKELSEEPLLPAEAESLQKKTKWHKHFNKHTLKYGFLGAVTVILLAGIGAVAWAVFGKEDAKDVQVTQQAKIVLMGAELSVVDGLVQQSTDNKLWKDVKVGDQVTEGTYVRAQQNGRAVIALDDGSAIRINNNSAVKINSLDATSVVIVNEYGEVYTRLIKSERQFSVNVADETYTAMGTAYITINTAESKGVEVYESKVKLSKNNIEVPEGKYFYNESKNTDQNKKLADISVDKVKQDAFLAWNYQQDKNSNEFKDKLGYLTKIDEPTQPKPAATAPAAVKPVAQPVVASIILTGARYDTGVKLTWKLTNLEAPKGFKVLKSLSANPTYGRDSATYVSGSDSRSYAWTIKDGQTYHFRVCIYTSEGCTTYSNDIAVTAPKVEQAAQKIPTGTLLLASAGGKNFSWTLNGSAPYGYKLVWSTSALPVYPGSDYSYYSSESTRSGSMQSDTVPGKYYVRVCMYNLSGTGDKCLNYSNELTVEI